MFFKSRYFLIIALLLAAGCTALPPSPTAQPAAPTATLPAPALTLPPAVATFTLPAPVFTPTPTQIPTVTPTLPPALPVLRGPYLQDAAPGSMWVLWDTAAPSTGWVQYGTGSEMGQVALETQNTRHHAVQLTGLAAGVQYDYQVGGDTSPASFHAAPAPGQEKFSFAVFGDTRSNPQMHAAIVARIAAASPWLVLHTGDLVADGSLASEWDAFLKIEAPLMRIAPLYPTLGNHENSGMQYFQIFQLPGNELWYAFDYGDARFIVLDADTYSRAVFEPGGSQRAWLESQLAGAAGKWLFVSFHVALHSSFAEDPSEVNLRNVLAPLFEKYQVTAVFNGHYHSYERVLANGVTYIVTGGGGAPLYSLGEREPGQQAAALAYHFVLFQADGSTLTGKAIDQDGKVIDSFTLTSSRK